MNILPNRPLLASPSLNAPRLSVRFARLNGELSEITRLKWAIRSFSVGF